MINSPFVSILILTIPQVQHYEQTVLGRWEWPGGRGGDSLGGMDQGAEDHQSVSLFRLISLLQGEDGRWKMAEVAGSEKTYHCQVRLVRALNENPRKQYSPAGAVGHGFPWASEGGAGAAGCGARTWHGLKTHLLFSHKRISFSFNLLLFSRLEQYSAGADGQGKVRYKRAGSVRCRRLSPRAKFGGLGDHRGEASRQGG